MATILIVDDDEAICALMRQVLEGDGHRVIDAPDGEVALQRFADDPADLVVIDLFMPKKGGWQTLRELQQLAPGLPFLIVSAGGALELVRRGELGTLRSVRGLAEYQVLRKPFSIGDLSAWVVELLHASAAVAVHRTA